MDCRVYVSTKNGTSWTLRNNGLMPRWTKSIAAAGSDVIVGTLVNEVKQAGSYEVTWDAAGMASGVCFCKLQTGSLVQTRKMLLTR